MLAAGAGRIINTASMASLLVPHPQKQARAGRLRMCRPYLSGGVRLKERESAGTACAFRRLGALALQRKPAHLRQIQRAVAKRRVTL